MDNQCSQKKLDSILYYYKIKNIRTPYDDNVCIIEWIFPRNQIRDIMYNRNADWYNHINPVKTLDNRVITSYLGKKLYFDYLNKNANSAIFSQSHTMFFGFQHIKNFFN